HRVGVASAALGITLLAGSVVALNTDLLGTRRPDIAGIPSTPVTTSSPAPTSSTPSAPMTGQISESNLPTGAQIYLVTPNDLGVETSESIGGMGESTRIGLCDRGLAALPGVVGTLERSFIGLGDDNLPNPGKYTDYTVTAALLQFGSEREATGASTTIKEWYATCLPEVRTTHPQARFNQEPTYTQPGVSAEYLQIMFPTPDTLDMGYFETTFLTQADDRVLVLIEGSPGQDYNAVGPYNAKLPGQEAGLGHFLKHYETILERLQA
ncbi:MAG TPA: hypothetical protein VLR88_00100, partial [Propionibacteriaceae bacterium]|nr:hypothetical protein [Propionibacteriaceae bacterium]